MPSSAVIRRRGQETDLRVEVPPPPRPPPHSPPSAFARQQAVAPMGVPPAAPAERRRGAAAAGAADLPADLIPSPSTWRAQLHRALTGKLFTLANLWTCALVGTVLLALIFRAMQPTEEPVVGIMYYEWELNPTNESEVRLALLELEAKGIGRFHMNFAPTTVVLRKPPPAAVTKGEEQPRNATAEDDWMPSTPFPVSFQEEDVLGRVEMPAWGIAVGHNGVMVTSEQHSGYFPYRPVAHPDVLLTAVFNGSVTVFASLPARIYMVCRIAASATDNEAPECFSRYFAHIRKG